MFVTDEFAISVCEICVYSVTGNLCIAFTNNFLIVSFFLISPSHLLSPSGALLSGKKGADVYIKVPLGTVVTERLSDSLQDFMVGTCLYFVARSTVDRT